MQTLIDKVKECSLKYGDFDGLEQLSLNQLRAFGNWDNNSNVPEGWEDATETECTMYWHDIANDGAFEPSYTLEDHIIRFINSGHCPSA